MFPAFPSYYGIKARFTNIFPLKCKVPSISAYHPNLNRKREAIFWATRRAGGVAKVWRWGGRSPHAGLREARHAPQRKSLSLIVQTKSETTAAPSISLSWHCMWWYSGPVLCADVHGLRMHLCCFVLCVRGEKKVCVCVCVLKVLCFSSCLLNSTNPMNHHCYCF